MRIGDWTSDVCSSDRSSSPIRYSSKVGDRRSLFTACSGKAILTSLAPKERAAILGSDAELADDLEVAVRRGWCEAQARTAPDVMGVGVPLVCGERRFGLAVAGPVYPLQDRRGALARALQALGRAAVGERCFQ